MAMANVWCLDTMNFVSLQSLPKRKNDVEDINHPQQATATLEKVGGLHLPSNFQEDPSSHQKDELTIRKCKNYAGIWHLALK